MCRPLLSSSVLPVFENVDAGDKRFLGIYYQYTYIHTAMSTRNYKTIWTWLSAIGVLLGGLLAAAQDDPVVIDPVLDFYTARSRATFESRDPVNHGLSFSLETFSLYKDLDNEGRIKSVDSARGTYFFSFGTLDSQKVDRVESDRLKEIDLLVPNVFAQASEFFFFPNDTGGAEMALGFDHDVSVSTLPVGLAIVDRDRYLLRWLYLFYPEYRDFERFSRSYRLVERDGYVFPDSIWEVGARRGVFSLEYYRLETAVTNITIYR